MSETNQNPDGKSSHIDKQSTAKWNDDNPQLNDDYSTIAALLADLNEQSAQFSGTMERVLDSVPAHDGLATLWHEQADVLQTDAAGTTKANGDNAILDDEISDEDEIILLEK